MYQFKGLDDTIAAIATPAGQGGIGIVRISGKEALQAADRMFVAKNKGIPSKFKSHTVHYGRIVRKNSTGTLTGTSTLTGTGNQDIIDEVLLTVMRAPGTYTRQDTVEISCHGGAVPLKAILNLAVDSGSRLAEPGEFTKRAFLNGRIDLTQAEAVLDIIQAKTDAFLKISTNQLKGDLALQLEAIREKLMDIYTAQEAVVNFPEDDVDAQGNGNFLRPIREAKEQVDALLKSSAQGRILREGVRIVICGKTNTGKSSLLNVLLKQPRAIVSEVKGTTRDCIEETVQIKGVPFQLVDTAGMIKPRDGIEQEALRRSHMNIQSADLILLVIDASQKMTEEDKDITGKNVLVVLNKCDLCVKIKEEHIHKLFPKRKVVRVSALLKTGIARLEEAIVENVLHKDAVDTDRVLVSNLRHIHSLKKCASAMERGIDILEKRQPLEFVSEEIKQAVNALDNITGRNIDSDLLDKIFSEFCIGK